MVFLTLVSKKDILRLYDNPLLFSVRHHYRKFSERGDLSSADGRDASRAIALHEMPAADRVV